MPRYSNQPIKAGIDALQPWLFCCRLNNTNGEEDLHWPLNRGIINYGPVVKRLQQLPQSPHMTLEMPDWETIAESLPCFELAKGRERRS